MIGDFEVGDKVTYMGSDTSIKEITYDVIHNTPELVEIECTIYLENDDILWFGVENAELGFEQCNKLLIDNIVKDLKKRD